MTFKANSDDTRDSLSFRVKKECEFAGAEVIWHDPHLGGSESLDTLLAEADVLVLCAPHDEYREIEFDRPVIDVWGIHDRPALEILPGTRSANDPGHA